MAGRPPLLLLKTVCWP